MFGVVVTVEKQGGYGIQPSAGSVRPPGWTDTARTTIKRQDLPIAQELPSGRCLQPVNRSGRMGKVSRIGELAEGVSATLRRRVIDRPFFEAACCSRDQGRVYSRRKGAIDGLVFALAIGADRRVRGPRLRVFLFAVECMELVARCGLCSMAGGRRNRRLGRGPLEAALGRYRLRTGRRLPIRSRGAGLRVFAFCLFGLAVQPHGGRSETDRRPVSARRDRDGLLQSRESGRSRVAAEYGRKQRRRRGHGVAFTDCRGGGDLLVGAQPRTKGTLARGILTNFAQRRGGCGDGVPDAQGPSAEGCGAAKAPRGA